MTTDDELIKKIASGDQKAFEKLFNSYGGKVLGYCMKYVKKEQAEEISQEVWMRVIRSAASYDPQGKCLNWLFTIARNLCFNALSKEQKTQDDFSNIADPKESVEETEINKEVMDQVFAKVDTLPLNQKTAVMMFYIEDKSIEEISNFLKMTINGVKTLLFRARNTLKAEVNYERF